jgi:AbrB family looped-hinge helix DNA binding protein
MYHAANLTKAPAMTVVTISSRYQVVIPKDVRERLNLKPGQKVEAIPFKGHIELIPLEPIESMRGFLRGIDTTVPREGDRV